MKKVLIFSLAYYPHVGGAEVAIKEITDRIAPSDIEFHMVTLRFSPSDAREERIGNVRVHRVGGGGSSYLSKILFVPRAAVAAARLHKVQCFDAAWAMMSYMVFPLVLAKLNIPYAITLQEGDSYEYMFKRLRVIPFLPLIDIGFKNAKVVQAISYYLAKWVEQRKYKVPVEVIPNGVDIKKFSGDKIPHSGFILVTASRLVKKNAIDDVIKALALPDMPKNVRFIIAGVGPDEKKLRALAKQLNVEDKIQWLGYVGHDDLPKVFWASDAFIRASRTEGMGNAFIEARAAGLPIIGTLEGGIVDFLSGPDKEGKITAQSNGFVVEKNSPKQIVQALQYVTRNPQAVNMIVSHAEETLYRYDWDLIAKDMREKVFAKVLKN